jgi:thermitase
VRQFSIIFSVLTFVMLAGLLGGSTEQAGARPSKDTPSFKETGEKEYDPDQIIVKLKPGTPSGALKDENRENGARTQDKIPRFRLSVVDLPSDLPVEEAVERYEESPDVEYAEPDYLLQASQTPAANDPDYPKLYGLNNTGQDGGTADADVDAPEAWSTTSGNAETVVAVIDSGVDIGHPDLKNNVWVNADEVAGNGIDDDGNGYVDDVNGWDFVKNDATVFDSGDNPHGTHVAGTIAAEGNNNVGVVGVNWRAQIMPLKFLDATGSGYTSHAIKALDYAVANGAKISNNSYGGGGFLQSFLDSLRKADAAGHLFIAAAGNGGGDGVGDDNDATPSYPASYDSPNVVAVAATNRKDSMASFSNYGATSVDIAAPGVGILSTVPGGYDSYSGTSMATPHVAGAAALLKSNHPSLPVAEIKAKLLGSVDKKSNLTGKTVAGGRLNAAAALPPDTAPPETTISSGPSGAVNASSAAFGFSSSEAGSRFECSLDGGPFGPCTSPKEYTGLADGPRIFEVRATDAAGNADSTPASRAWTVDATAPVAEPPAQSLAPNSTLGTSAVPVKLTWSANDGTDGSGAARYELQQSTNGGAYSNVSLPTATATNITRSLAPNYTYRFRARAQDKAGNWSAWAEGPAFKVTAYQESSSAIVDTGAWTTAKLSGAYGGKVQHASLAGRSATFAVPTGTKDVAWVSTLASNRGQAEVWLDGVKVATVDLYDPATQKKRVVFSQRVDPEVIHKLEVRVLGTKNGSSTGTRVDVDAFVMLG